MLSEALDVAAGSLHEIAEDAGISYDTLWAWKIGRRNPSPKNLAKLADALERRGGEGSGRRPDREDREAQGARGLALCNREGR